MTETVDLSREIQTLAAGQARPIGHRVQPTTGTQSPGVATSGDGAVQQLHPPARSDLPDRDYRGPAMAGGAHDFAWRPQDRFEAKAYRETMAFVGADAVTGVATVDPNLCVNFWINSGGNIVIALAPFEAPDFDDDEEAPTLVQSSLVTIYVQRNLGATLTWPGGIAWSADVRSSMSSDNPFGPATGPGQIDVFTLQHVPAPVDQWFGYIAGTRMA